MNPMLIGVISDIHGHLSQRAAKALDGVDMILCAGDIERPSILWELEAIAPTICVLGNCDHRDMGPSVKPIASPLIEGVRFRMVHRPQDNGEIPDDVQVVINGHTHIPRDEVIGKVRYLNPGSTSRPRGGSSKSLILMTVRDGAVRSVKFVDLTW